MSNLLKNKKNISELMMRAESIASEELLMTISGGTENACHDEDVKKKMEELVLKPCTRNA
nr:hypothetical protein BACY1_15430 [Tenacibaculum mesophilum]